MTQPTAEQMKEYEEAFIEMNRTIQALYKDISIDAGKTVSDKWFACKKAYASLQQRVQELEKGDMVGILTSLSIGAKIFSSHPYTGAKIFTARIERSGKSAEISEAAFSLLLSVHIIGNPIARTNREYEYSFLPPQQTAKVEELEKEKEDFRALAKHHQDSAEETAGVFHYMIKQQAERLQQLEGEKWIKLDDEASIRVSNGVFLLVYDACYTFFKANAEGDEGKIVCVMEDAHGRREMNCYTIEEISNIFKGAKEVILAELNGDSNCFQNGNSSKLPAPPSAQLEQGQEGKQQSTANEELGQSSRSGSKNAAKWEEDMENG